VAQEVYQHTFANGFTLLAERMEHVRSASMSFLVPAGCGFDPPEQPGLASVATGMITRGAGPRDSRQLTLALDNLGFDRGESVGVRHLSFAGSTIARNLPAALALYADILRRPHFPEEELEPVQASAVQAILALEDDPSDRVMVELDKHLYPTPLSNDHRGTIEGIKAITPESVRQYHRRHFHPQDTVLSVAGNIEWASLLDQVGQLFGDWQGDTTPAFTFGPDPEKRAHLCKKVEQTQITVAYPSVPKNDPDFYVAMAAVNVLSGGMGSRLFTEIREKEGLCYSVGASYQPLKDRGSVIGYAASLNDMAERTLVKLLYELRRLPEGIEEEEVARSRVQMKTALVKQQESTMGRTRSMTSDWYHLGRIRLFEEVEAAIKGLTAEAILRHLRRCPPADFHIVTLGPKPLTAA
jgi:predicted Zn-dependent peptidase